MNLTPRQLEVREFIRSFRAVNGYSPTMREMAIALGVSKTTIFEHFKALEKKRVIRRDKHKARSVELCEDLSDQTKLLDAAAAVCIKIGACSVGIPLHIREAAREYLELHHRVCGVKETVGVG